MKALLARKVGMTQLWDDHGRLVAGTVISAEPNAVIKLKDNSIALATTKIGRINKAQEWLKKLVPTKQSVFLKVVKGLETDQDKIDVGQFEVGDKLIISGRTKGKGFAGTIKRHNFHRGPVSHGSHNIRQPGSIGAQQPQRVPKGKKMAGHMGDANLTVRGNKVLMVDAEKKLMIVSGAVPGAAKSMIVITSLNQDSSARRQ